LSIEAEKEFRKRRRLVRPGNFGAKKIRKEFGFDSCQGISSGENDISTHGCGLFPRISECQVDYDLIRQKENKLEIGDRYAEFTSCAEDKRPVAMGFTLEKQKE